MSDKYANCPECFDIRPCCFRHHGKCTILTVTYDDSGRACPFCKAVNDAEEPEEETKKKKGDSKK